MTWSKIWRVARTEYLNNVRTKAFIIGVVLMPVMMGGSILVQALAKDHKDVSDRRVAIIDASDGLGSYLIEQARVRNETAIWEEDDTGGRTQKDARWTFELTEMDETELSEKIRSESLFAYIKIPADVTDSRPGRSIGYHTNTPTYEALPDWITAQVNREVQRIRMKENQLSADLVAAVTSPVSVGRFGLVSVNASTGEVQEAEEVNRLANFLVPLGGLMMMFMLVMMSGPQLMNSVLEEKMQRISEVLVSSVGPFELFLGKLLGTVLVSWTLAAIYLGGIAYLAHHFGFANLVPPPLFGWFLALQLAGLFIFGSIFMAIGAACNELRDAQSLMMPAMLLVMVPLFTWTIVIESPGGPFAVALSIFPTTAPFIMLLRLALPPGPSGLELGLSLLSMIGFTIACVWAAGRIFRVGLLHQGQTPNLFRLFGWIFVK